MLDRRTLLLLVASACHTAAAPPATRTAPLANTAPPPPAPPSLVLSVGPGCDLDSAESIELAPHDTLAVVTCSPNTPTDEDSWPVRAYLVRRSSPTAGTEQLLGAWEQGRESGEYFAIAGVVKDRAQHVTRVIVQEVHGGLDQGGDYHLTVYDPARAAWTGQDVRAPSAKLETAPDGSVTIHTCKQTVAVIDQAVACEDSANPVLDVVPVR